VLSHTLRALRVPRYPHLLATGWLWALSRWGVGFLGGYLARELSDSARLIQLTGVALWAPLLLGGVAGGVIADRLNRRVAIVAQLLVVAVLASVLGLVALADRLELWMVYPFLVVVGTGWVIDMTCRRTIVYELVGPDTIDNAMALESVSTASSLAAGALVGGAAIEAVGIGAAFGVVAGLMVLALALFLFVPVAGPVPTIATGPPGSLAALRQGVALLRSEPALISVLGVTAAVNFFYFSFTPLVQRFGQLLGADAFATGLLASMTGFGMMTGSALVARFQPRRRGLVYLAGSLGAMVLLIPFTRATTIGVAMFFLLVSGIGMGMFGSTQGTLVLTAVDDEVRGRAMGLLSTAIGVLPAGMIALGELAEVWGARDAVLASVLTGIVLCCLWVALWRQVIGLTA
jgi:predicted MFS family arabinose efflux permease